MTDDFQLFQDASGDDAMDADIALITAYLARELSPVQVVAVEDRLAKDAAFLTKVRPILDAWTLPAPLMAVHAGPGPLSRDEVEAGWQRYVGEHAELDAHEGPRLMVEGAQRKRRKISMTRIAAGIAAITLPVITLAQVAVYVSHHPDIPGHSVAKQVVAPFVAPDPAPPPEVKKPLPSPEDVRVGRPLEKNTPAVQRAGDAQVPVAPRASTSAPAISPLASAWTAHPDRARIGEFVIKHMPEVTRGDTTVSYVVLVLDASDNYVWGTYGNGTLQIRIGGDKRSQEERNAFNRENASEYTGLMLGARGGFAMGAAPTTAAGGGMVVGGGRARGGGGGAGGLTGDTLARLSDSMKARIGRMIADSSHEVTIIARDGGLGVARGGGGRGGAIAGAIAPVYGVADSTGGYLLGSGRFVNGQPVNLNQAAGLQDPANGESGIQGLKASSLTMGETYLYAPGQLANQMLRVVVVHLAPGTGWKGR